MNDCIFCKIIKKEIPADIVYETEDIICFRDIRPVAPIHVLVIPKKHIEKLTDLKPEDDAILVQIYKAINEVAKLEGVSEKGFRVIANCGEDGGQVVGHLHFHVLGGKILGPKLVN